MTAGFLLASPSTSDAGTIPANCVQVGGNINTTVDGSGNATWTLNGTGVCESADFAAPQIVTISGTASSNGTGYCSGSSPVQMNLVWTVTASFLDTQSGNRTSQQQVWTVAITPGTAALPFAISGDATGAGTMFTRVFAKCAGDPTSSPSATFDWTQTL